MAGEKQSQVSKAVLHLASTRQQQYNLVGSVDHSNAEGSAAAHGPYKAEHVELQSRA